MRVHYVNFLIYIVAIILFSACSKGSSEDNNESNYSLFNGENLKGWTIQNDGQFSVEEGLLKVNRGTGWLRSKKTFGDFTLFLEFRFLEEGANSGIFVRTGPTSHNDESGWPDNGYQIQCMDTMEGAYPLGAIIDYGAPPFQSDFDREVLKSAYRPTGEWQTFEITCVGETITVKLNGITVSKATDIKNLSGHAGIQGEMGLLEFKKIEVSPL